MVCSFRVLPLNFIRHVKNNRYLRLTFSHYLGNNISEDSSQSPLIQRFPVWMMKHTFPISARSLGVDTLLSLCGSFHSLR